jgi:hypothetical protein
MPERMTKERIRLQESRERTKHWKRWGPYLSERAWGTVREDYSEYGTAWDYFPHDHARSRAYRWNEDGIAGICDRHQILCFALAMWNGKDPILKERLFGLNGTEGNHGEDVKEYYFYLDSTPTHSYMKFLYKYPQAEYPYQQLTHENQKRDRSEPEFELLDTGIFDDDRYFDVFVEYAKADSEDICIRITVANRGPETAHISLLPTLWFRNTWSWDDSAKPQISVQSPQVLAAFSPAIGGEHFLYHQPGAEALFTENETNHQRLFNGSNATPYVKDSFNEYVVHHDRAAVNPQRRGTKAGLLYEMAVPPGKEIEIRLRLTFQAEASDPASMLGHDWDLAFRHRKREADEFYKSIFPANTDDDSKNIMRQAFAGLLWSKQFYHFVVRDWLNGDPAQPKPPEARKQGRNKAWVHLYNSDVISMPDKWEYPWYAAWDLAFHCVALAVVDPDFAKEQLVLMTREWYMHPNGQIPAYEWAFGDVNPPVHARAAIEVYLLDKKANGGKGDRQFLERVFHKLLLNFTWWINRKDVEGQNVFQGGFLGLDNIGVFDRSATLPTGGHIEQSDGTSWMAMYSLDMLAIALVLAFDDPVYEDVAVKFWEHFIYIAKAMNKMGDEFSLWDEEHGFFYDMLHLSTGERMPMRVRSMVGLIPLYACQTIEPELLDRMPTFKRRMEWFIANRPDLTDNVACMSTAGTKQRRLLAIPSRDQLVRILKVMFDEKEFFSDYGIRALSRYHADHPFTIELDGTSHSVDYEPGESTSGLFGGNSNWRGPIWMPVNYLLIRALRRFYNYYGNDLKIECPTGSGNLVNLMEASDEIAKRIVNIFRRDSSGRRPLYGKLEKFQNDPHWKDYLQFHEYFHGDTGFGIGAAQQTGWTALVAKLIVELEERSPETKTSKVAAQT